MSGGVAHYSRLSKSWWVQSEREELNTLHFAVLPRCVSSFCLSRGRYNLVLQPRRWNIPSRVPLEKGWNTRSIVLRAVLCSPVLSCPLKPELALSLHGPSKSRLFTRGHTDTADVTVCLCLVSRWTSSPWWESPGSRSGCTPSAGFSSPLPQPLPAQTSRRCENEGEGPASQPSRSLPLARFFPVHWFMFHFYGLVGFFYFSPTE